VTSLRYPPLQEKGSLSANYETVLIKTATAVLYYIHNKSIIICGPDINSSNVQEVRIVLNLKTSNICLSQSVNSVNTAAYKALRRRIDSYPGIKYQWGRDFPHPSRPALGPTLPPILWVPGLSRG